MQGWRQTEAQLQHQVMHWDMFVHRQCKHYQKCRVCCHFGCTSALNPLILARKHMPILCIIHMYPFTNDDQLKAASFSVGCLSVGNVSGKDTNLPASKLESNSFTLSELWQQGM